MSNLTIKHASRLIARYKTCLINTVPHTSVELRRYTMNPEYYEALFAATVAQQASLYWPLVVEMKCHGCRVSGGGGGGNGGGGDGGIPILHMCQLPPRFLVDICFERTLTLLDRDGAERQFCNYLYPRPVGVLDNEDWFERLWGDGDWLRLVRSKLASILEDVAA